MEAMEVDFTEKIKGVFDVCDTEGTGFITVDHLKDLAKDHFGAGNEEETVGIIQLLDPEGKGKVSFQDFCQGVQQILEVQGQTKQSTPIKAFHYTEQLAPPEPHDTSEASAYTFNDYDTNTDDDTNGQLLIDFSTPETSSVTSKTDEDNYEDYGVVDLESDSSCDSCHRSRRRQHRLNKGQLARSAGQSPINVLYDDIDGSLQEFRNKIQSLEKQVAKVTEEKNTADNVSKRFKDDNTMLIKSVVDRMHGVEEQLKDMEVKSSERVRVEQRKYQDIASKLGSITTRLQTSDNENEHLKSEIVRLKHENDRLRMDKTEIADRLSAMEEDYNRVSAEFDEMMTKFDRERGMTGNLLDELQKELEDLRRYKIDCEHKHSTMTRTPSITESNGYPPLAAEMQRLKETLWLELRGASKANKHLAEENEELNAQLIAQTLREGQNMLREGNSLAEELDHLTKEELTTMLRDQQDKNIRLSQYVDKILLTILEKNPSMLEIH